MGLRDFTTWGGQMSAVNCALHLGGGLFFCTGSMGFIQQVNCGQQMVAIGAWSYIVGSLLYVAGASVAIARDVHTFRSSEGNEQTAGLKNLVEHSDDSNESMSDDEESDSRDGGAF